MISELIIEETKIDRPTIRKLVKDIEPVAVWVYNSGIDHALRCRDDRLKAGMNMEETHASL